MQHVLRVAWLFLALAGASGCGTLHAAWVRAAYPPEGEFFIYDGLKIHYVTGGRPSAETSPADSAPGGGSDRPTIVYVHGDFGSTRDLTMSPLWPVLCAKYHVVAFDRPGYGYSPRPPWRSMSSADHAEILHEVVRRLGGSQPIIIGHSRGARIALDYACKYSAEIRALLLVSLPPEMPNQEVQPQRKAEYTLAGTPVIGDLYLQTVLAPVGSWAGYGHKYLAEAFKPHAAGGRVEDLPPDYARVCIALALRPSEFRANELDAERAYPPVGRFVASIGVPVYIVQGYLDNVCVWQAPAIMHCEGWFADSHLTLVGDGAHQLHWTHPGVVARAVENAVSQSVSRPLGISEKALAAARRRAEILDQAPRTFVRVQGMDYVNCEGVAPPLEPSWAP